MRLITREPMIWIMYGIMWILMIAVILMKNRISDRYQPIRQETGIENKR